MEYQPDPENLSVDASIGEERPDLLADVETFLDLLALRRTWAQARAIPVLIESRNQGVEHNWARLDVRTYLRGEQSSGRFTIHNIVLAPGAELPVHYQSDAYAFYLVLDGAVEMRIGNLTAHAGKYSFGFAPPLTRQGFRNTSNVPATVVAVFHPGGVDRAFAAAHHHWMSTGDLSESSYHDILARFGFRFGSDPLANDELVNAQGDRVDFEFRGGNDLLTLRKLFAEQNARPRLVTSTGEELGTAEEDLTFRKHMLTGDESGGAAMLNFVSWPPAQGAKPHHQPTEEEFFFIIDGKMKMTCGSQTEVVGAGAVAFCPRNTTHAFSNGSPTDRVTFVTLNSPAGHERTMLATRKRAEAGATPDEIFEMSAAGGFIWHELPGQEPKAQNIDKKAEAKG